MNGEKESIEFKRELSDKVDVEKEVIAFLNSRTGGVIRIGVDDDGNVIGLADADGDSRKIKDRLKNNISPSVAQRKAVPIAEDAGTGVSSEVPVKIALKTSVKSALENKFAGFSSKVLGNAERVLVFLGEHESATFEQIAAHVGATRRTAVNYVNLLKERGFIRRIGPDKGGHWEVVEPESKAT